MSLKRFIDGFLGLFAATVVGVVALNFIVNPYAIYPTEFVESLAQTSHAQKTRLLSRASEPPGGLILGSSRVLKYEPEYLTDKFDVRFFNAGVKEGKSEDHLALLRYYRKKIGCWPEVVLLGLEVHNFNDHLPINAQLLGNGVLVSQIPEAVPFSQRFQGLRELLSGEQTLASFQSLGKGWWGSCSGCSTESFQPDGLIVYHQREEQIKNGTYDFDSALEDSQREHEQLYANYGELSQRRIKLLESLLDTCRENATQVIVFLTPMHPDLVEHLADTTTYSDRHADLSTYLSRAANDRDFVFCDLSNVASFAGSADLFVDGTHPLEPNTRLAIDQLAAQPESDSLVAAQ